MSLLSSENSAENPAAHPAAHPTCSPLAARTPAVLWCCADADDRAPALDRQDERLRLRTARDDARRQAGAVAQRRGERLQHLQRLGSLDAFLRDHDVQSRRRHERAARSDFFTAAKRAVECPDHRRFLRSRDGAGNFRADAERQNQPHAFRRGIQLLPHRRKNFRRGEAVEELRHAEESRSPQRQRARRPGPAARCTTTPTSTSPAASARPCALVATRCCWT